MSRARLRALLLCLITVVLLAGCRGPSEIARSAAPGRLLVVAAENFWGSIAAQLGGGKVTVDSIIVNPSTDPHAYEPTASDGIAVARSQLAIVNGIGYDGWASKLISANSSDARAVLDVGTLMGLGEGANPHQWYSPASVRRVVKTITADLERLDPKDSAYFESRRGMFETRSLAEYDRLTASIRSRYAGVPVGYSESIFAPLGHGLGLRLMTPASFTRAIAEGADVSAADKGTVDAQAQRREIKVWILNSQNLTPDVQRIDALARSAGIPITTITETLSPASASFQAWQVAELNALQMALHRATGR